MRPTYKLYLTLALTISLSYTSFAHAADPYTLMYNSHALNDLLRLDDANKISTGKGVTVGVVDGGSIASYVLNGKLVPHKDLSILNPDASIRSSKTTELVPNKELSNHAVHVSGIIAASQNGFGMQGIAYDANIAYGSFVNATEFEAFGHTLNKTYTALNQDPNIKVVNNSWGAGVYLDFEKVGLDYFRADLKPYTDIFTTSTNAGKLLVFAAGNHGHLSPMLTTLHPYVDPTSKNNILSVINLHAASDNWERTDTGGINMKKSDFVNTTSNLAKYAESYTLAAPGTNIFSSTTMFSPALSSPLHIINGEPYQNMTGTSMSAPIVTGVAALVQSKFQYLSGKQIGDVLLSTANKNISSDVGYIMSFQDDSPKPDNLQFSIHIYSFVDTKPTLDEISAYIDSSTMYGPAKKAALKTALANGLITYYTNVPYELIFGQGILDAGKAVNGLGSLNARRLTADDYSNKYNNSGEALYKIDTMGYDSTWSNDINEVRVGDLSANSSQADLQKIHAFYAGQNTPIKNSNITQEQDYINWYNKNIYVSKLDNLAVGLWKTGAGVLTLSGNNTYTGSSVADDGLLRIDGSVLGDAFAVSQGSIGGNGTVRGSLSLLDSGIVLTGNIGTHGTTVQGSSSSFQAGLTVAGDLNGKDGRFALATDSQGNGLAVYVKGSADISSGKVVSSQGSIYKPNTNYAVVFSDNNITGSFIEQGAFTGMLDLAPQQTTIAAGDLFSSGVFLTVSNNLTSNTSQTQQVFEMLEAMRTRMEGNTTFSRDQLTELYSIYSLDTHSTSRAFGDLYGGTAASLSSATVRNTFVEKSIQARANDTVPLLNLDDPSANIWFRIGKDWGNIKENSLFEQANSQSFGAIVGYDKRLSNQWLVGGFIAYNSNKLSAADGTGENHDLRLGTYAKYQQQAFDLLLGLNIGAQNNTIKRELSFADMGVDGKYQSKTAQFTAKASYDLSHGSQHAWSVKPYAALNYTHYRQDAYNERAASIFAQQAASANLNYLSGELGFDFSRPIKDGRVILNIGYKRILSGYNPTLRISMAPLPNYYLETNGIDYGRNFLVLGMGIELAMKNSWSISASLDGQFSSRSNNYGASLNLVKSW